jgi:2-isopropylmalate synthase
VVETVIAEGATTINIPDTVGYAVPELYGDFIRTLARKGPQLRQGHLVGALPQRLGHGRGQLAGWSEDWWRSPSGVHHQRVGRARRQLFTRGDCDGGAHPPRLFQPRRWAWKPTQIVPASRMVSQTTGFVVQPNKAVVGANAFAHAIGIHQDGVLKARDTYEIMRAEDVGWSANKIVLG